MGETTIAWTDFTFQPWIGCQRVSPGCEHCYAEAYDKRVGGAVDPAVGKRSLRWGPGAPRIRTSAANWRKPLKWDREAKAAGVRHRVFCASLADVFEDRPELAAWRADLFALIDATRGLDWLLLTKRPENIRRLMPAPVLGGCVELLGGWLVRSNVWLGTTVEDQRRAYERIPHLVVVPAVVRFLSCEPLLESVDIGPALGRGIAWVIVGGESGGKARPFDVWWAHNLMAQCRAAGAAPFVKQLGSRPVEGRRCDVAACNCGGNHQHRLDLLDHHGSNMAEWPEDLRVREFPRAAP